MLLEPDAESQIDGQKDRDAENKAKGEEIARDSKRKNTIQKQTFERINKLTFTLLYFPSVPNYGGN